MEIKELINLKRLNSVLKKNYLKVILIIFLFALCGTYYSFNIVTPKYKSTSTILLGSNNINKSESSLTQTDVTLNNNLILTYSNILKSHSLLEKVINNLNMELTEEELYKNIKIEALKDTQIIKVSVINDDAVKAQKIAEELNNVFVDEIKQLYKMDNVNIVDKASLEDSPYNINHIKDIAIFVLAGIAFSGLEIFVIYMLDTSVKIEQDIEEYVGLNVIGSVPIHKRKNADELIVQSDSKSVISESLKTIRTNIAYTKTDGDSRAVLFTSCNSGEGKSWIASNMAVAYSQSNKNVIIVDADLRKGRQHRIFKVKNNIGLSNYLKAVKHEKNNFDILERYIQETDIPKVHIMTIGTIPPNPSELLLSSAMGNLIEMLKRVYDVVVVDGTPCNLVSDSIPVSKMVDTTILVTESKRTKIEDLKNVVKLMRNAGANIGGAILNKKDVKKREYGKSYYYGYGDKSNNKIQVKRHTVKELIENRKEFSEQKIEVAEEENDNNNNQDLELLKQKLENIENKINDIQNIDTDKYDKNIESLKKIYQNEINKVKLSEEIKRNITNNEILKKLNDINLKNKQELVDQIKEIKVSSNGNDINELREEIKQLSNSDDINELKETIKQLSNNDDINELKEAVKQLSNNDDVSKLKEEIKQLSNSNGIDELREEIKQLSNSNDINDLKEEIKNIKSNDYTDVLDSIKEEIEILDKKYNELNEIDNSSAMNDIIQEIQILNNKYEMLKDIDSNIKNSDTIAKINEMLSQMQNEHNRQLSKLDNSDMLNNIVLEIQNLERKYRKIENIENAIYNDDTEERIQKMIEKAEKDNQKRIEKLDNSEEIKLIIKELKKINSKYDELSKKLENSNGENVVVRKQYNPIKDNIIQIKELKNKFSKNKAKELEIRFGDEIEYSDLLETASEVYEIKPDVNSAKA